jgi:hypothetical protein
VNHIMAGGVSVGILPVLAMVFKGRKAVGLVKRSGKGSRLKKKVIEEAEDEAVEEVQESSNKKSEDGEQTTE